ncbi:hypothetical protein COCHEDRAFT_1192748, partial [Bipolaris maydis C5]
MLSPTSRNPLAAAMHWKPFKLQRWCTCRICSYHQSLKNSPLDNDNFDVQCNRRHPTARSGKSRVCTWAYF